MKNLYTLFISSLLFILMLTGCSQKIHIFKKTKYTSKARHKATMKSYNVLGKRYHPSYVSIGQVQRGVSSWYGPNFHGKYTSNGEVYNMHARTAAHKTWPMDTMVRVTNLKNGKSTVVRINDRGPFVKGRIIDCSYTAGKEIGLDKMGIAPVKIEVIGFAGELYRPKSTHKKINKYTPARVKLSNFGIQVGAFANYEGAQKHKRSYLNRYPQLKPIIKSIHNQEGIISYRVWLMGFSSEQEAREFKENNELYGAFIVRN
jgi:rare lipoprotein A